MKTRTDITPVNESCIARVALVSLIFAATGLGILFCLPMIRPSPVFGRFVRDPWPQGIGIWLMPLYWATYYVLLLTGFMASLIALVSGTRRIKMWGGAVAVVYTCWILWRFIG